VGYFDVRLMQAARYGSPPGHHRAQLPVHKREQPPALEKKQAENFSE
jgi:hypothetical protein